MKDRAREMPIGEALVMLLHGWKLESIQHPLEKNEENPEMTRFQRNRLIQMNGTPTRTEL